ncbi:glyoxylase-like metal-dependent hydrolase (beta-lactamase superfamily II) [Streptococcus gallinaceus]|uniref:MBL fold metallo-hydrolase n=1 Tax=Streptococcus gallinaceus TaxID=165758 RepID=UPI0020A0E5EF|nr:MBL fold metallo-hydrolase [Streptococcus gallinaceus]MCP1639134.1 glyoxylase-like metal-dependent hydrolase (beta-lactamase superfamily II) [Streptococcus gallinaceus]MCP1769622.1 glyoxylase-like metal-dependent hydrolase (beta-lactamase superfamily II) [Streptococcus gallinaceus]
MGKPTITLGLDNGLRECQHWQITEQTYAIQCPGFLPGPGRLPGWGYCISYLIIGQEKALLIDTDFGISDLKAYVEQLTSLPLMVVNSHVHPDHSGSNRQSDTIFIGKNEWPSQEAFVFSIETVPDQTVCPEVENGGDYRFDYLEDGQIIDLGKRTITVLAIPGHTKGSIGFFDHKSRYFFSGDAIVKRIFYGAGVPLSQYRATLEKVKTLPVREILSAHWPEPLPTSFLDQVLHLIDTFDPTQSEHAKLDIPDAPDLRMFHYGQDFDDPDFCAMSFRMDQLDDILQ